MHSAVVSVFDPSDRFAGARLLDRCFASLGAAAGLEPEAVVIVNASVTGGLCDGYLTAATRELGFRYVVPDAPLGTSAAANLGVALAPAGADTLVFVSHDAELVDAGALEAMWDRMRRSPTLAVVHPLSVFEDSAEYNISRRYSAEASRRRELSGRELRRCCKIVGRRRIPGPGVGLGRRRRGADDPDAPMWTFPLTLAMFRLDAFRQLGGMDERFWYCHENNDYALRAIDSGFGVARVGTAFVNHRRYVFRAAGSAGAGLELNRRGHDEGMERWLAKWGRPYGEIVAERLAG